MSDTDTVVNLSNQRARSTGSASPSSHPLSNEFVGNGALLNLPDKLACLVTYGEMFILVSGRSGQGKSLAKTQMLEQLADFLPVLELKVEQRKRETLTDALLVGFRLNSNQRDSRSGLAQLKRFTRDLAISSRKAVVVVDDAHCLTNAALKTLLDLVEKAGLGLILFAEPSIDRRGALKAAAAQIYRCPLERLDQAQARSYLRRKQPLLSDDINQSQLDDILRESKGIPSEIDRRVEDILHEPRQARGLPMIHVSMLLALLVIGGAALWFEQDSTSMVTRQSVALDAVNLDESSILAPLPLPLPLPLPPAAQSPQAVASDRREDAVDVVVAPPGPMAYASAQASPSLPRNVSMAVIMPTGMSGEVVEVVGDGSIEVTATPAPSPDKLISLPALNADAAGWIYSARPGEYTLQLMGSYSLEGIEEFINSTPESDRLAYFVTRRGSDIWYVLTAGRYPSREAAVAAISALPPTLSDTKPWARSVASIRASLGS